MQKKKKRNKITFVGLPILLHIKIEKGFFYYDYNPPINFNVRLLKNSSAAKLNLIKRLLV